MLWLGIVMLMDNYYSYNPQFNDYNAQLREAQAAEKKALFRNASKLGFLLLLYNGLNYIFSYVYLFAIYWFGAGKFTLSYATVYDYLVEHPDFTSSSLYSMLGNFFIVFFSMLFLLIVARSILKINLTDMLRPQKQHAKDAVSWFPVTMTLNMLVSIIISIFTAMMSTVGVTVPSSDLSIHQPSTLTVVVQIAYVIILGPVCEEILYRGIILTLLKPYGKGMAIFVSAIIFGVMHGNIPQAASAFASALVFGAIAVKCNSIVPTIIIHILNNTFASVTDITDALGITGDLVMNIYYGLDILIILIGIYLLFTKASQLIIKNDTYALSAKKRYFTVFTNIFILAYFALMLREYVISFINAN